MFRKSRLTQILRKATENHLRKSYFSKTKATFEVWKRHCLCDGINFLVDGVLSSKRDSKLGVGICRGERGYMIRGLYDTVAISQKRFKA